MFNYKYVKTCNIYIIQRYNDIKLTINIFNYKYVKTCNIYNIHNIYSPISFCMIMTLNVTLYNANIIFMLYDMLYMW